MNVNNNSPRKEEEKVHEKQMRLGKKLAYLLRYGAEKEGIEVSSQGYVLLDELMKTHLLDGYSQDDILKEIENSRSIRRMRRFEVKENNDGDDNEVRVRASYGRRMERCPFHPDTKVQRLLDRSIDVIASNIQMYDFFDFPENYLLNLIMRRMKRKGTLTNKCLRQFLVPTLTHLDLWSVYVTEGTLKSLPRCCPELQALILRDCGYVVTDHLLCQILKGLPSLQSLNLCGCHHVTDKGLEAIAKNCPSLRHLNLTFVSKVTPKGLINLITKCTFLEELNMYDYKGLCSESLEKIFGETEGRDFRFEVAGITTGNNKNKSEGIYDSVFERANYR